MPATFYRICVNKEINSSLDVNVHSQLLLITTTQWIKIYIAKTHFHDMIFMEGVTEKIKVLIPFAWRHLTWMMINQANPGND